MTNPEALALPMTIAQLAKRLNVPRVTLWRRLLRIQARTNGSFLTRDGRVWRVNVERLREEAPEFGGAKPVDPDDSSDHEDRILALEGAVAQLLERRAVPARPRKKVVARHEGIST